jgi:hypothetical protein
LQTLYDRLVQRPAILRQQPNTHDVRLVLVGHDGNLQSPTAATTHRILGRPQFVDSRRNDSETLAYASSGLPYQSGACSTSQLARRLVFKTQPGAIKCSGPAAAF